MRFFTYICVLVALCAIFCGCGQSQGSGNVLTDIRKVDDFSIIKVSGVQLLSVEQGSDCQVKVTADDNVIRQVLTYTRDGVLIVENRSSMKGVNIEVFVTMPDIRLMEVQNRVKVDFPGSFGIHDFDLRLMGSGSVSISNMVSDGKINLYTQGSGNVRIGGSCKVLKFRSEGSGSVFAENMTCPDITAKLTGPGSVFVSANGKLAVQVDGPGSLFYTGTPATLQKSVRGAGSVQPR